MWPKINDLRWVLRPLEFYSVFSSTGPYSLHYGDGKFESKINVLYLIYGYFIGFLWTGSSYLAITEGIYVVKLFGSTSRVLAFTERIKFTVNTVDMTVLSAMIYYKADVLGKAFTRIHEAEAVLEKLSMKLNHRELFFRNLFALTTVQIANFVIIYFVYYFCFGEYNWKGLVAVFYMYSSGYLASMMMTLFMTIMNLVVELLNFVGEGLEENCDPEVLCTFSGATRVKKLKEPATDPDVFLCNNSKVSRELPLLWEVYDACCDVTELLCSGFGIRSLIVFGMCFTIFVVDLFSALWILMSSSSQSQDSSLNTFGLVLILFSSSAVVIIAAVINTVSIQNCKNLAERNGILLSKVMLQGLTAENLNYINKFIIYIQHLKPNISSNRMFEMDNTLIFTMVGALTNYIIFLVQFAIPFLPTTNKINQNITIIQN